MFDTFFDCLNGRSKGEHIKRRKPNLKPYYKADDERLKVSNLIQIKYDAIILLHLQWLKEDFLGYLKQWEESVQARRDVADSGKTKMLLSRETLEGLYITGKCEIIRIKLYLMFSVIISGVINFTYC